MSGDLNALADRVEQTTGADREEWRVCAGTDRRYQVSSLGRVRRNDGLMLTPSVPRNTREYPAVMLRHTGERKRVSVHRLVAMAFHGLPPFAGAEVRHLDGDHCNPIASNLAWGTRKENAADRERHGRTPRGPRPARRGKGTGAANGNYRVTPAMKAEAHHLVSVGYTQRQAAGVIGISQKSVWSALRARAGDAA